MYKIWLFITIYVFGCFSYASCADFSVFQDADNDCSDSVCDLRSAFALAGANGEDDIITIADDIYIDGPLVFESTEQYSLRILGEAAITAEYISIRIDSDHISFPLATLDVQVDMAATDSIVFFADEIIVGSKLWSPSVALTARLGDVDVDPENVNILDSYTYSTGGALTIETIGNIAIADGSGEDISLTADVSDVDLPADPLISGTVTIGDASVLILDTGSSNSGGPTGGQVVSGDITITESGSSMGIIQSPYKTVINWDSFSIDANEIVQFVQPNADSADLNATATTDFTVFQDVDDDCSDLVCDLRSALDVAAANGQDDIITLGEDIHIDGLLLFESTENYSLKLTGDFAIYADQITLRVPQNEIILEVPLTATGHITLDSYNLTIEELITTATIEVWAETYTTFSVRNIDQVTFAPELTATVDGVDISGSLSTLGNSSAAISVVGGTIAVSTADLSLAVPTPTGSQVTITASVEPVAMNMEGLVLPFEQRDFFDIIDVLRVAEKEGVIFLPGWEVAEEDDVNLHGWMQTGGVPVRLTEPGVGQQSFDAPALNFPLELLSFEHSAQDANGSIITTETAVAIVADDLPFDPKIVVVFDGERGVKRAMAVAEKAYGVFHSAKIIDPTTIKEDEGRPRDMMFGLLDCEMQVENPGDIAELVVYLSEPLPAGYGWFKYNETEGWIDFSDNAEISDDRTMVTLTLVDGGVGDDDGEANGIIVDPSGPGLSPTASLGASGSGCFIATAAYGSYLEPRVMLLRQLRDRYLLKSDLGRSFVKAYYRYSPPMADFIVRHDWLRMAVRFLLLPLVGISWLLVNFGFLNSFQLLLFIFCLPLITVLWLTFVRISPIKHKSHL